MRAEADPFLRAETTDTGRMAAKILPLRRPDDSTRERRPDPLLQVALSAGKGDQRSAATLLQAVGPQALRVIRSVLGRNHPDEQDVLQECLLAILRSLPSFRGEASVAHFALTIVFRRSLAAKRRARDVDGWVGEYQRLSEPLSLGTRLPSREHELELRRRTVAALLSELPEPQAEAIGLRLVLGFSIEEIAVITKSPINTVRSRLRLAKVALRERILADEKLREMLRGESA
jgi:RNA polymerase sigma-70 factor (ECF subfamily)